MDMLYLPQNQLLIYVVYLVVVLVLSSFDAKVLIMHGVAVQMIWIAVSVFIGLPPAVSWSYYLELTISLLAGNMIFFAFLWLSDKYGRSYNGEGSIILIAPLNLYVVAMVMSLLIKLLWQWRAG